MADRPTSVSDVLNKLDLPNLSFTILAELEFSDGTVNLWLGPKNEQFDYDGKTWTGVGDLASIDQLVEVEGISEEVIIGTLHATSDMIDTIELEDNEGQKATFYVLIFNYETREIVGHIETRREMGAAWIEPEIFEEPGRKVILSNIKMEFVGEGFIMNRSYARRLTYTDGLEIDPNDHFLEFIADPELEKPGSGPVQISQANNGSISETQLRAAGAAPVIR